MSDSKPQAPTSADSDALNKSGTKSTAGGSGDLLGPDGDDVRERTDQGKMVGNHLETDNEGRVTQRSNSDI
ncbi:MAG: hypothetical protein GIW97_02605 [Candidatus Eremiobacteraeota bacterium]|nr:hypothetical protein [Candidatus Eremiobacteraeota bacterium]